MIRCATKSRSGSAFSGFSRSRMSSRARVRRIGRNRELDHLADAFPEHEPVAISPPRVSRRKLERERGDSHLHPREVAERARKETAGLRPEILPELQAALHVIGRKA